MESCLFINYFLNSLKGQFTQTIDRYIFHVSLVPDMQTVLGYGESLPHYNGEVGNFCLCNCGGEDISEGNISKPWNT